MPGHHLKPGFVFLSCLILCCDTYYVIIEYFCNRITVRSCIQLFFYSMSIKKLVLIFAIFVVAVSCEKDDASDLQKFYLKSEVEDISLFDGFKDYNSEDCSFYAENISAVTKLISSETYSQYQWEVFNEDGTLLLTWPPVYSQNKKGYDATVGIDMTVNDCDFHVAYETADKTEYAERAEFCIDSWLFCDPLLSVYTSSEYWKIKDENAMKPKLREGYISTEDLNTGCGFDSDYARAYFGGLSDNIGKPFILDADLPLPSYDNKGYTISGLRLVVKPGGNPSTYITDPDGIEWMLVGSCAGNSDMNNDAGGDYLYLYFTTNYTGRKITLVNPRLMDYDANTDDGYDGHMNKHNSTAYMMLGSICTWISDDSPSNKITVDDFKKQLVASVKSEANSPSGYIALNYVYAMNERVDFIRMYDDMMYPLYEGYPANFNRGAKGDYNIFISYSYITESDASYWSRF